MSQSKQRCGIYAIERRGSQDFYIGSSKAIRTRWSAHRNELKSGSHHSFRLQRDWNKHGAAAFVFYVLEECTEEKLIKKEQQYLDLFAPIYNICKLARSKRGTKHSEEQKAVMRRIWDRKIAEKTHCKHGHEYTPQNTYIGRRKDRIDRRCQTCNRNRTARIIASETSEQKGRRAEYFRRRYLQQK